MARCSDKRVFEGQDFSAPLAAWSSSFPISEIFKSSSCLPRPVVLFVLFSNVRISPGPGLGVTRWWWWWWWCHSDTTKKCLRVLRVLRLSPEARGTGHSQPTIQWSIWSNLENRNFRTIFFGIGSGPGPQYRSISLLGRLGLLKHQWQKLSDSDSEFYWRFPPRACRGVIEIQPAVCLIEQPRSNLGSFGEKLTKWRIARLQARLSSTVTVSVARLSRNQVLTLVWWEG
jgi:hypothetical protein